MYKSILLIDDDGDDQELFMIALQRIPGHSLWGTAEHGLAALKKLTTSDALPDLIFLDLNMPLMNGQEFLKEIKTRPHLKDIPIIVHSTTNNLQTIEEVRGLGAFKFFPKPVVFDDMIRLLRSVLDGSSSHFVVK